LAEIGFAVNLSGEIYSPEPYDGPGARTFRDENDRFLSNRENVEVYSSNSLDSNLTAANAQFSNSFSQKLRNQTIQANTTAPARLEMDQAKSAKAVFSGSSTVVVPPALKDESRATALGGSSTANDTTDDGAATQAKMKAVMSADLAQGQNERKAAPGAAGAPSPQLPPSPAATTATATLNATTTTSVDSAATPVADAAPSGAPPLQVPAAASSTVTTTPPVTGGPLDSKGIPPESSTVTLAPAPPPSPVESSAGGLFGRVFSPVGKTQRLVIPQQMVPQEDAPLSNAVAQESDFRRVIGKEASGMVARFLENQMRLMVWSHPSPDTPIVFGAQLDRARLIDALKTSFQIPEITGGASSLSSGGQICVAILDDAGHPVALSREDFKGDWKHPFVATEIGEVLPHWEAALYLVDPGQIGRTARTLRATLGLIVLLLVAAIVSGGSLIAADVRRQVRLAQQKTDFVSNVSHELKTPLTSIRMFADLLAEKRVPEEARQATYLRIISAEAARLTRLINNVLDFARLEKGAPPGEPRACDLLDAVRDVVDTCGPHLEAAGVAFTCEIEAETLPICGDRDALAQIILNLISNAEKYGGNDVLVRVRRQEIASGALGCIDVLDRGAGIPARQVRTIFEPFHRLDDSLSSGIPGSGLGLTLARRMARAHGGDVTYSPRAGGGSCFTLAVPLRPA
jgi:signal transduction histidine kinase